MPKPPKAPRKTARPAAAANISPPEPEAAPPYSAQDFPIVGIGASAGGLEALGQFLGNVPPDSGMAFVAVQHLDPTQKSLMTSLLQGVTALRVRQARDGMTVEPNCAYVIPPNQDMAISQGALRLFEPAAARGLRLPIDFFFRSLAEDRHDRSVGVVLSGMGTDGTLGVRAIKEKAGLVLAQEPGSAKFEGMPRSVIDGGLADIVAPAQELPGKIVEFFRQRASTGAPDRSLDSATHGSLAKAVVLLRLQTGHDFSQYKKSTLYRRAERRMALHRIPDIATYVRYLQENLQERELLFHELLIGVTSFFRDPAAWDCLKNEALPALLAGRKHGEPLRAWVAGCSTGEEAYSLAIVLREALEEARPPLSGAFQVFATDLDRNAVDKARQAVYPANIVADVPAERLRRYFVKDDHGRYRVGKEIRESVIFAPQSIIMDPPFTRLDILCCRNLLIYLTSEVQKKIIPMFHYALNPGGVLFLGTAESVGSFTDLFAPVSVRSHIFSRGETGGPGAPLPPPSPFVPFRPDGAAEPAVTKPAPNLQTLADQALLQRFSPAAVLVSREGDILYVSGRTGRFLEPAAGRANWNVFAMAREGLSRELTGAFAKALCQKAAVTARGIRFRSEGGEWMANLTVQVLDAPVALLGKVMVVFAAEEAPPAVKAPRRTRSTASGSGHAAEIEREVENLRESLQGVHEEMQASQEELRSANEELQSANEELQSTNEELTTSREEMQSLNEELQTVNAQIEAKVEELSSANNDMKNLLNSTEMATVFLDGDLNLRRFTKEAIGIINLIPSDVGRPLIDIVSAMNYPELARDATEVLRTLAFIEKEIPTRDGRWYRVRIMPYRTLENMIDGVVVTFINVTEFKLLEKKLRQSGATEAPGPGGAEAGR